MDEIKKLADKNDLLRAVVDPVKKDEVVKNSELEKHYNAICGMIHAQNNALQSFLAPYRFCFLENFWSEISSDPISSCCINKCINFNFGVCRKGNGYLALLPDGRINYIHGLNNNSIKIHAGNHFNKSYNSFVNDLYYYEVNLNCLELEEDKNEINKVEFYVGLFNENTSIWLISEGPKINKVVNNSVFSIKLEYNLFKFTTFGCGIVYPRSCIGTSGNFAVGNHPYVFFTANGKLIGQKVEIDNQATRFKPTIRIKNCSVAGSNFGVNKFAYDVNDHIPPTTFEENAWNVYTE
ncbi:hypothetical protein Mgra_00008779 [Meloidogyne graminicola]|uniref:SPRY domain-containing protein n=1 Tax=Meloidogyne graminicola TaxID=189291 RepID=A0A8S9ZEU3_9BILA|nr:hypothetical protein Mgra_00008779 [Meloidogyne graminicola]